MRFVACGLFGRDVGEHVRDVGGHLAHWPLNFSVKCSYFRFEFAEGQNTKIQSKYQNSFQAQNAKISAVSTPILTGKAAFFSIFRALSEKSVENG